MKCFRFAFVWMLCLVIVSAFGHSRPKEAFDSITLTVSPTTLGGGGSATGTLKLSNPAPNGGTFVQIFSENVAASVPASVKIPAGKISETFQIKTAFVQTQTAITIQATLGSSFSTATLTVLPISIQSLSLSPTSCIGGGTSLGTVTLNGPAPVGGTTVNVTSSSATATIPASFLIPSGQSSGSFEIDTSPVFTQESVTITAAVGAAALTAKLAVSPTSLLSISVVPASVNGGVSAMGTINLTAPAPSIGLTVNLSSSTTSVIVPPTVKVNAGKSTASFTLKTIPVLSPDTSTITASAGSVTQTASLTVEPPALVSVSIAPGSVFGGSKATGTINLSSPAHAGGMVIQLQTNQGAATVPINVTIPQNGTHVKFDLTTIPVLNNTPVVITASSNGVSKTCNITIDAPVLHTFSVLPLSIIGGAVVTGTLTLNAPSPSGGITVALTSKSTAASIPVSVSVPAGATYTNFEITTSGVKTSVAVSITAKLAAVTKTATFTVGASTISSFSLNPTSVPGGTSSVGTLILNGPAPTGGATVHLSSNSKSGTVPTTIVISAGQTSTTFNISTSKVKAQTKVTIAAALDGASKSAVLTVTP